MRNLITLLIAVVVTILSTGSAIAGGDTALTYQGRLLDAGEPANGLFDLAFSLWDDANGGNLIGLPQDSLNTPVTDGLFTVQIDFGADAFDNADRWLEIEVGATKLWPRQPITRTPYSIQTRGIFVDEDQNVGIGTTTPSYNLEVRGDVNGNLGYFSNDNTSSGNAYGLYARGNAYDTGTGVGRGGYFFGQGGSTNGSAYGTRNYANAYGSSNAYGVYSNATGGTTTGREYAFYGFGDGYFSGNVGIGTSIPSYKLEVTGDISGYNGYFSQKIGIGAAPGTEKLIVSGNGGFWADGFLALKNTNEDAGIRIYDGSSTVRHSIFNDNNAGDILRITPQGNYGSGIAINQNGYVGIGTSTTNYQLEVTDYQTNGPVARFRNTSTASSADGIMIRIGPISNPGYGNTFIRFQDGDSTTVGQVYGNGAGGISYGTTSDARLKTNIADFGGGLDMVSRMKVRKYEFIQAPGKERIGFIAQELQTVFPQAVSGDPEGDVKENPMGVDYGRVTPVLVSAIQELNNEVQQKDSQITELQARLTALEAMVEQLVLQSQGGAK